MYCSKICYGRSLELKKLPHRIISGFIYVLKSGRYYKIGRTTNVISRMRSHQTSNPNLKLILSSIVADSLGEEKKLLSEFKEKNHKGEWFLLKKDDINKIKKYLSQE